MLSFVKMKEYTIKVYSFCDTIKKIGGEVICL